MRAAEEHHVAGRVAGAVVDLERLVAEPDGVAVVQPLVGLERFGGREAEALTLRRQLLDPEALVFLRADDRHAVVRRERLRARAVIDVAVREQHFLELHVLPRDLLFDAFEIAAGIDDGGAAGLFADEQRAVLLERRDRNERDFHGGTGG
jgi:hypothetical protein